MLHGIIYNITKPTILENTIASTPIMSDFNKLKTTTPDSLAQLMHSTLHQ